MMKYKRMSLKEAHACVLQSRNSIFKVNSSQYKNLVAYEKHIKGLQ